MPQPQLPRLLEPADLKPHLGSENFLIVDLGRAETYAQAHVPGAVHLDYARLVAARPPVLGLLPEPSSLSAVLGAIGLTPESHVIAYDDEGGGAAARLLWTLDAIGHTRHSLLNGGLHAWLNERLPASQEPTVANPLAFEARVQNPAVIADKDYILNRLRDPGVILLDARTPAEYRGEKRRAERAGHIPGAVNFEWINALDRAHNLRLKPEAELRAALEALGVTPDREIIAYCQTHHRSAHTYQVLKILGYPRVRGYPGSWSEWGNRDDTPVE